MKTPDEGAQDKQTSIHPNMYTFRDFVA